MLKKTQLVLLVILLLIIFYFVINNNKQENITTELYKKKPKKSIDCGYYNKTRGWYDIQKKGVYNDYCRYVGDPPNIWFSCQLEGSSNPYTPPSQKIDPEQIHLPYNNNCFNNESASEFLERELSERKFIEKELGENTYM